MEAQKKAFHKALLKVNSTPEGKLVINEIIKMSGFYSQPVDKNLEFFIGRRSVGMIIYRLLHGMKGMDQ